MKKKISSVILSHKRVVIAFSLIIPLICLFFLTNLSRLVTASFGSPGDTSLIHACKDNRGRLIQIDPGGSCNNGETLVTFLKDVDAGSGLNITRSSSGATLSLASSNSDGWTAADETWTYASADDPSFTFTVSGDKTDKYSPGMRIKLTQTTKKYFLITSVSYSSPNTTLTVYGGTDYDLANASITNPYYSTDKAPQGFPLDPTKWTVSLAIADASQANPTSNTWYNVGGTNSQITIPIGAWTVTMKGLNHTTYNNATSHVSQAICLSTANNSCSDTEMYMVTYDGNPGSLTRDTFGSFTKYLVLTSKTTYYANLLAWVQNGTGSISSIEWTLGASYVKAISAYL